MPFVRPRVKQRGDARVLTEFQDFGSNFSHGFFQGLRMALIDLGHDTRFSRRPLAAGPAAPVGLRRIENPSRPRPVLPKFCRINAGQIGRTLLLVSICVGFWNLPQPHKIAPKATVAAPTLKPF
jgi:hypothetical protein